MLIKDLRRDPNQNIQGSVNISDNINKTNPLIIKYNYIDYDIDIKYIHSLSTIEVNGQISFSIQAKDARDGKEFEYKEVIDWNDEYCFESEINSNANILIGDEFDIDSYAIEQINMNIPVNLSINHDIISKTGSGWKVISEQEYLEDSNDDEIDPRWEKINQFSEKNKN